MKAGYFSSDIIDLLDLLDSHRVVYLIVGGEAVIYYGNPRLTGDIDLFYRNTGKNIEKLYNVLLEFWDGDIPGIRNKAELANPGYVIQFGVPPNRVDFMNEIEGVDFNKAWDEKQHEKLQLADKSLKLYFIGLNHLIKNKQQTGRPKDLEDVIYLKNLRE